jgi:hypothetical protein
MFLVAVLLIVPGTFLSIAFGAIGGIMLLVLLGYAALVTATGTRVAKVRLGPFGQLVAATALAAVLGGIIGFVAWLI